MRSYDKKEQLRFLSLKFGVRIFSPISPGLAAALALKIFSTPTRVPPPPWEKALAREGHSRVFRCGLHAIEWGKGRPVLLVHGWQGRGTQLGFLVKPLIEKGFRVIAIDGIAHGESPGRRTSIVHMARKLVKIGTELGEPVAATVGHSFGACASALAVDMGMKSDRLVLVAAPSDLNRVVDKFAQRAQLTDSVVAAFRRQLETWGGYPIADASLKFFGSRLTVPVLVVHDPEDPDVDFVNAEIISTVCPNAKLLVIRDVGHRKILKSPIFIEAVREFLFS